MKSTEVESSRDIPIGTNPAPTHRRARKFPKFEVARDFASFAEGDANYGEETFEEALEADASERRAATELAEPTMEQRADVILGRIGAQGELREILYKLLDHCRAPRMFGEAEAFVLGLPEVQFGHVVQTPYSCIQMLVEVGGLEKLPVDAQGNDIEPERLVGLSDDEADDLIEDWRLATTEAGTYVVELLDPARRLAAQLAVKPHRKATYLRLLGFCAEEPRTLSQIQKLFSEDDTLVLDYVTAHQRLAPDYYVDRLEKAGGLVWRGAWVTTEAGRALLANES